MKKRRQKPGTQAVDTLIGAHTEILGDVRFAGGLHVDGKIKGKVLASVDENAFLSVSERGSIEGDVRVPHIMLNGEVIGDVYASTHIALSEKARVTGNVYYRDLQMESGAAVNGQLVHEGEQDVSEVVGNKRTIAGDSNDPKDDKDAGTAGVGA